MKPEMTDADRERIQRLVAERISELLIGKVWIGFYMSIFDTLCLIAILILEMRR